LVFLPAPIIGIMELLPHIPVAQGQNTRMGHHYRPLLEVFREALRTLQNEPGPMIPAKAELMEYLRARIAQHEGLDRATAAG